MLISVSITIAMWKLSLYSLICVLGCLAHTPVDQLSAFRKFLKGKLINSDWYHDWTNFHQSSSFLVALDYYIGTSPGSFNNFLDNLLSWFASRLLANQENFE